MHSLDAVSMSEDAISLIKCRLEIQLPATLVLLNLLIRPRVCQSQTLR